MTIETQQTHQAYYKLQRGKEEIIKLWPLVGDKRGYIGGSFAAWLISPMDDPIKPNDIDIFAKSNEDYYLLADILDKIGILAEFTDHTARYEKVLDLALPVQLVKPLPGWANWPNDVLDSFDLNVCRAIFVPDYRQGLDAPISPSGEDFWRFGGVLADDQAGTLLGKVLRINDPLRTLKRIYKYQIRGVGFSDHEMLKVFRAWESMAADKKQELLSKAEEEVSESGVIDSNGWDQTNDDDYIAD